MTSTETATKPLDQAAEATRKDILGRLQRSAAQAETDLQAAMAKFAEHARDYGVTYAMKFTAEELPALEWELGIKRRMVRRFEQTGSLAEAWKVVRELALMELCDTSQTGNLFAAADNAARRGAAVRWMRRADERLEDLAT